MPQKKQQANTWSSSLTYICVSRPQWVNLHYGLLRYWWQTIIWHNMFSLEFIFNTLRPRQNGRHCPDDVFKCNFLNKDVWIPIKISLNFVSKGPINNIPALVQIMAWRRPGDKPLSEPMMVRLPKDICVTRPQWYNRITLSGNISNCKYFHSRRWSSVYHYIGTRI